MTLVLEIEYLTDVVFAARGPESYVPDWPPQPDRIFSALVATWGTRREQAEQVSEAEALKWLERQQPPRIAASQAVPRTAASVYVPPNDFEIPPGELEKLKWYREFVAKGLLPPKEGGYRKAYSKAAGVMPNYRERKGRNFPATLPYCPTVRLYWEDATPPTRVFEALRVLATDTSYVGHSASLTRCRFLCSEAPPPAQSLLPKRRIYGGRFDELRESYKQFVQSGGKNGRPLLGERVVTAVRSTSEVAHSCFDSKWLVLEHTDGEMRDMRAAALIAKEIHKSILSGYSDCDMGDRIPTVVSGHNSDKSPTREPHLAIVPLAFAGFRYGDGHLLGFALVPPRDSGLLKDQDFLRAMIRIAPLSKRTDRRAIRLFDSSLELSPTFEPDKRSLDSALYTKQSMAFATVTPIVLDRHLKEKGTKRQEEVIEQIKSACANRVSSKRLHLVYRWQI